MLLVCLHMFTHISAAARMVLPLGLESKMNSTKICPNSTTGSKLQYKPSSNMYLDCWKSCVFNQQAECKFDPIQQQKPAQSGVTVATRLVVLKKFQLKPTKAFDFSRKFTFDFSLQNWLRVKNSPKFQKPVKPEEKQGKSPF